MLYQVFHRLVSMLLIVSRSSLERQRIDRVLRSLFVENIFLSVVPVGETGHVRTHLNNGFGAFNDFLLIRISWQAFLAGVSVCCRRTKVHLVRIDNLCLFLQIECLLVTLNMNFFCFVWKILLIVREQLWVRITDKPVSTTSITNTIITSWEFCIFKG